MSPRLLVALLAALFLLLVSTSGPASAHATLVGSNPEDGASVDSEPAEITLSFNEDVSTPAQLQVTAPDGSTLADSDPVVSSKKVSQQVSAAGLAGTYTIAYRVVSSDGHPISGELTYDVTSGKQVEKSASSDDESFAKRHATHLAIGGIAVLVAVGLLVWPWVRRRGQ